MKQLKRGISIIICCYNSSWIIEETLQYIFSQRLEDATDWEIILVDNASTDGTGELVKKVFTKNRQNFHKCKLVREEKPGLIYARNKGINESQYEYLLFCDDDNLLSENYIQSIFEIMDSDPRIGACGGKGIPFIKGLEPAWFPKYQTGYAVGSQKRKGEILQLYGAGICIRKTVLEELKNIGFESILTGRKGNILLAGEDAELTMSAKLIGYKLYASDKLLFQHVLSEKRMTIDYLLKMYYGFGYSDTILFYYRKAVIEMEEGKTFKSHFKNHFTFLLKNTLQFVFKGLFSEGINREVTLSLLRGFFDGSRMLVPEIKKCQIMIQKMVLYKMEINKQ